MKPLRVVFFGTPDYAVPTLERLATDPRFAIELVVTQPDRPAGRGRKLHASEVKMAADRLHLPLYQPASLRTAALRQPVAEVGADVFVVAAYGLFFGQAMLALPRLGCLNLHASLLPTYRGASPIAAAILAGDDSTGVSLMKMDPGLDTGPVIANAILAIDGRDSTGTLAARLAESAAELAADAIPRYASGQLPPEPQRSDGASLTRPLTKADGWLDWREPAALLERRVRAMWSWPRAWTVAGNAAIQIFEARRLDGIHGNQPGLVLEAKNELIIGCGDGALALVTVQPAGGKPMSGRDFGAGRWVRAGDRLGVRGGPEGRTPIVQPVARS